MVVFAMRVTFNEHYLSIIGTFVEHNRIISGAVQHSIIGYFLSIIGSALLSEKLVGRNGQFRSIRLITYLRVVFWENCCVYVRGTVDVHMSPIADYDDSKLHTGLVPSPTLERWIWLPVYSKLGQHYVSGPSSGPAM